MNRLPLLITLLGFILTLPLKSEPQQTPQKAHHPKRSKLTHQQLRVIPIGASMVVRFKFVADDKPPEPIQGRPEEYLPENLYIKEKSKSSPYTRISISSNSLTHPIRIKARNSITLYRRTRKKNAEGKPTYVYTPYVKTKINPKASQVLVAIIKSLKKDKLWASPIVRAFDVSPDVFPSDSCFVFSASPFKVGIKFESKKPTFVEGLHHQIFTHLTPNKYGVFPYKVGLKIGDKFKPIRSGAFRKKGQSRHYIFAFVNPRKGLNQRGDIAVFTETHKLPKRSKK